VGLQKDFANFILQNTIYLVTTNFILPHSLTLLASFIWRDARLQLGFNKAQEFSLFGSVQSGIVMKIN
jgi:hypothetical protein